SHILSWKLLYPKSEHLLIKEVWRTICPKRIIRENGPRCAATGLCRLPDTPDTIGNEHIPRMNAIETDGLTRKFGERVAVDNLTLRIPVGAVFGFLGPNGAGKTTTVRMLAALIEPTK